MTQVTKADRVKQLIIPAYDLGSVGVGVQKQLVSYMILNPTEIRNRVYLVDALQAGTRSNMIATAGQFGREIFPVKRWIDVSASLQNLGDSYPVFEAMLWRTLAYGTPYARVDRHRLDEQSTPQLFEALAKMDYFSRAPTSPKVVEKFLKRGFGMEFGGALAEEGVEFDYDKIVQDRQTLMLGDARKDSVVFHAYKLKTMAKILRHAITTFYNETGEFFRLEEDAKRQQRWKELFDEDIPFPAMLSESAMRVVDEADEFAKGQ